MLVSMYIRLLNVIRIWVQIGLFDLILMERIAFFSSKKVFNPLQSINKQKFTLNRGNNCLLGSARLIQFCLLPFYDFNTEL
jgi:hypothetical protein